MEGLLAFLKDLSVHSTRLSKRLAAYQPLQAQGPGSAYARDRELVELARLASQFPDSEARKRLEGWLEAERSAVEMLKDEFRFGFGRELAAGLEGSGLGVKGQLPALRVGLFTVKADFESGTATVFWGPEIDKLKSGVRLVPAELARTLRQWHESLRQQEKVAAPELLSRVRAAYKRHCLVNSLSDGAKVFLVDLLSELVLLQQPQSFRVNPAREKFVEYPRIRFSFDLYRLKRAGVFDAGDARLKLHVANFDATAEKSRAVWVPDNDEGEGTHYSYISFAAAPRPEDEGKVQTRGQQQ